MKSYGDGAEEYEDAVNSFNTAVTSDSKDVYKRQLQEMGVQKTTVLPERSVPGTLLTPAYETMIYSVFL